MSAADLLWEGMMEEIATWPIGYDPADHSRPDDDDYTSYRGDMVAGGALRAIRSLQDHIDFLESFQY